MKYINDILNKISMYRLAIYYLASLLLFAIIFSFTDILPYNPADILLPAAYLVLLSYFSNFLFSKLAKTTASAESAFITGLILALIVGPTSLVVSIWPLTFIAITAMASKYLLAWRGRHMFNPAAFGVFLSAVAIGAGASWWIGSAQLVGVVLVLGLVLIHKINEWKMVSSFLVSYFLIFTAIIIPSISSTSTVFELWSQLIVYSPILFFTFIMLPEPKTSPGSNRNKILYGAFTAIVLVVFQAYINVAYSMELALLSGNAFAFFVSREGRMKLVLKNKKEEAENIFSFWFESKNKFSFEPGQFLEYTVNHKHPDSRGVRRYFTIASSPTEDSILLSVKIPTESSTFKNSLKDMDLGKSVIATGPKGSFTLPDDKNKKIVFIAGGIGVTPFRSMVKYLVDKNVSRDITLMYLANKPEEFAFMDLFDQAKDKVGLNIVQVVTDQESVPDNWSGEQGTIDADVVERNIPDMNERMFYVSGPEPMVRNVSRILVKAGIKKDNIKRDFFPGYEGI